MARDGAGSLVSLKLRMMTAVLVLFGPFVFSGVSYGEDVPELNLFTMGHITFFLPSPAGFSAEKAEPVGNEYLFYSANPPAQESYDPAFPYREALSLPGYVHPIFTEESFLDAAKRIETELLGEGGSMAKAWPLSGEVLTRLNVTPDMVSRRQEKERVEFFVENAFSSDGMEFTMQHSLNLLLVRNKILVLRSAQIYGPEHRGPTLRVAVWDWIRTLKAHEGAGLMMSLDSGKYQEFEAKHEFHLNLSGKTYTLPYSDPVHETFLCHPPESRTHMLDELSAAPGDVARTVTFHEYPILSFIPDVSQKDPRVELALYSDEFSRIFANSENLTAFALQKHGVTNMENEAPGTLTEHDASHAKFFIQHRDRRLYILVHFFRLDDSWLSLTFTSSRSPSGSPRAIN